MYDEQVLVDQLATHERLDQFAASHHEQIARSALLELRDRVASLSLQQRRVRPRERLPQGPRADVLGGIVEPLIERAVLSVTVAEHLLVRPTAEQQAQPAALVDAGVHGAE